MQGDAQHNDEDCGDAEARTNGGAMQRRSVTTLKRSTAVVVNVKFSGTVA